MRRYAFLLVLSVLMCLTATAKSRVKGDTVLLSRIFHYAETVDTSGVNGSQTYAYQRFHISTDKRNVFLLAVPSMYGVAHGGARQFAGEFYDRIQFHDIARYDSERLLEINSIPHRRRAMSTLLKYMTPEIYNTTIVDNYLLSPFNKANRRFYRYTFINLRDGRIKVIFKAKVDNTQLVSGRAIIDELTGRVISTDIFGELDMVRFQLNLEMGTEGLRSLLPVRCALKGRFNFLGSKITANYMCRYGLTTALPDSIKLRFGNDKATDSIVLCLADSIRPEPLTANETKILNDLQKRQNEKYALEDSVDTTKMTSHNKKNLAKAIFWDILGDHLLNRVKSRFGTNDQGYLRINPILNPLYFGYSNRRGITYKFDIRASYDFTPNRDVTLRIKSGYSFKQRQLFCRIPLRFNYNKRRHAFLAVDVDYGHRLYNSEIANDVDPNKLDSLQKKDLRLDYFRDTYLNIYNNYDISDQWSFNVGFTIHKRDAVSPEAFHILGLRSTYRSTAPRLEVQYRPLGWKGPIITLDYEHGIKGILKSTSNYERWEVDGSYIHNLPSLQAISLRLGGGIYSRKENKQYFLDFTNFRENNIPGGWNDDWSGEFELLRSAWYNTSRYYLRFNSTYESPLLLASHLPGIGHFFEMERLYIGAVHAEQMKPYIEFGYGFTTRWISLGAFVGNKNGHFERIGCRFGFELFRKW